MNYSNRDGLTPLHFAIERQAASIEKQTKDGGITDRTIKFLLKAGANPHHEDIHGEDCCDKAQRFGLFNNI